MKVTTVRYTIASDRVDENIRYVRAIFAQLQETAPPGLHYACTHASDGSFLHILRTEDGVADDALTSLAAFEAFRAGFRDRAVEGPTVTELEIVGNYGIF